MVNRPDDNYVKRHIGFTDDDTADMLKSVGFGSLDDLMRTAIPDSVLDTTAIDLPDALGEFEVQAELRELAGQNESRIPLIGLGYHRSVLPAVIRRNVLENPAWYTAYTPYQPEISQGRLELLLVFQNLISDLVGLPIANASLLDEPTAAAEAMGLTLRMTKGKRNRYLVDADTHPQTLAVLQTRALPQGIELDIRDLAGWHSLDLSDYAGALVSLPGSSGRIWDPSEFAAAISEAGGLVTAAVDPLSTTVLTPPGEWGADIAIGSAQRFGVPLGFGGPHAGFMAVREGMERSIPGRLVGVSEDSAGRPAYRLALQTREQHIRREKATSNICTSQVLLANIAALYAAYHGPVGLVEIAQRINQTAIQVAATVQQLSGWRLVHEGFFDTVLFSHDEPLAAHVVEQLADASIDVRLVDDSQFSITVDEVTTEAVLDQLAAALNVPVGQPHEGIGLVERFARHSEFMQHPWFSSRHSETEMMRWLRRLADADLALDRTMIPLGSCTMKLNAAAAMEPITWPGFADIHPFAPQGTAEGYRALTDRLEQWLSAVTGYAAVSLQPNAGSQGEFAGLLAIKAYLESMGQGQRDVCLIPSSAHGTNAASAAMAGMRVVVVKNLEDGRLDLEDVKAKIADHADDLAAIMITYPSTYGVYEDTVTEVADLVHQAGGQVYVDGANLNALVGWAKPGGFGSDVSHLNLHKTFCIPHGGGGPGVGPIGVAEHLVPFLPGHPLGTQAMRESVVGAVSGAPYGSAGILPIPYAYVRMMGAQGLTDATAHAVLAANYIAARLKDYYPVLFVGQHGLVAHECILDLRELTKVTGVTVDDVAKRLVDHGFHAPTMSFPIAGTLMVEPTESENKNELDRFCDAMIAIAAEIEDVKAGRIDVTASPLRLAPHTSAVVSADEWDRDYPRSIAAWPTGVRPDKYWPPVGRIDGAYGDRNLMCSCPPVESFETSDA